MDSSIISPKNCLFYSDLCLGPAQLPNYCNLWAVTRPQWPTHQEHWPVTWQMFPWQKIQFHLMPKGQLHTRTAPLLPRMLSEAHLPSSQRGLVLNGVRAPSWKGKWCWRWLTTRHCWAYMNPHHKRKEIYRDLCCMDEDTEVQRSEVPWP